MLSITEIEQINQKLNPELALSLSLDNAKRMESSLLHSGFFSKYGYVEVDFIL